MLLLGIRNTTPQELTAGELLNLGETYRRYDRKGSCGLRAFEVNSTNITLQHSGIYHVTATITFTGAAAGDAIFQLAENGIVIPGAVATETVTTATTEIITTVIDFYVLVDSNCILNSLNTLKSLTLVNTGIDTTVTNLVFNITKEV